MTEQILGNLYRIELSLPNNPLKWLNSYLIKSPARSLLIDTGFNLPSCLSELLSALDELDVDLRKLDVFLTHCHADHTGNAGALNAMGCRIFINSGELAVLRSKRLWPDKHDWMISEGMPEEVFSGILETSPAVIYASGPFDAVCVEDGSIVSCGGFNLRCIRTPGHARGHMCLWDEKQKLLFTGDHVLFDISPNICSLGPGTDSLGDYLRSLDKIRLLPAVFALPSHRSQGNISLSERIDQLKVHHAERLLELESCVKDCPGMTAYEIAGLIKWKITARSWDDFPISQKWFAVGEALAHIDFLLARGRIKRIQKGGIFVYR